MLKLDFKNNKCLCTSSLRQISFRKLSKMTLSRRIEPHFYNFSYFWKNLIPAHIGIPSMHISRLLLKVWSKAKPNLYFRWKLVNSLRHRFWLWEWICWQWQYDSAILMEITQVLEYCKPSPSSSSSAPPPSPSNLQQQIWKQMETKKALGDPSSIIRGSHSLSFLQWASENSVCKVSWERESEKVQWQNMCALHQYQRCSFLIWKSTASFPNDKSKTVLITTRE